MSGQSLKKVNAENNSCDQKIKMGAKVQTGLEKLMKKIGLFLRGNARSLNKTSSATAMHWLGVIQKLC